MNSGDLHLALRDLRAHLSAPLTLGALAGVAVVLGISGPFGTLDAFALIPRMAYWAAVVPLTYAAGFVGTQAARLAAPKAAPLPRMMLAALGSALAVTPVLAALNTALAIPLGGARAIALGFAAVYVICLVVEGVSTLIETHSKPSKPAPHMPNAPQTPPALLSRLPLSKRGAIWALSAQDHYTEVTTSKGRALVLIRLADAIAEAAPTAGLQIHRSHWAALCALADITRSGADYEAVLTNGARLPVARARLAALRAAGLLPRKSGE